MIEAINNNSQANRFEHIISSGKIEFLISMKAMKERFHKQIVRKYKQNYFATARKDLLQQQEFFLFYERVLESGDDLISLLHNWGYVVFFKHVGQILDQRLYHRLFYQNQKYFLQNLNFLQYLLQLEVLPVEHIDVLVSVLSGVVQQHQRISAQNTTEIFLIVQKILTSPKYLPTSLHSISTHSLLPKLYELTIRKQANEYFFKIIKFVKLISNDNLSKVSDQQKLHCLQIHILTSSVVEELAVSYYALGEFFQKHHTPGQELYEYGSILDKTMKDIAIDRLIDSISYFLIKALTNHSLKKLSVEMGYIEVLFDVILDHLMVHNSGSIHGHQSIWSIFRLLITNVKQNKKTKLLANLDWKRFKERLAHYKGMHFPYLKIQVDLTLTQLSKTNETNIFLNLIPLPQEQIVQQLQEVQI